MVKTILAAAMLLTPFMAEVAGAAPESKTSKSSKAGKATKPVAPTKVADPEPNVALGKEKADSERCMECHGEDGQGSVVTNGTEGHFAKLAGQHPAYVLKQIRDFRSGARKHDQMAIMARSVSDEDVRDIAAYFAGLPVMAPDGSGRVPAKAEALSKGRALFEEGDAARGVPSCASCHGPKGEGIPAQPLVPIVGGQEWRYVDKQLRDWRAGERRNGPDPLMNQVTKVLTDKDIEALATYLSGM
jgi:cytochrome c553